LRVLIITGSYPPDKCGVGDYSYHLAEALAARSNMKVGVLTSVAKGASLPLSSVEVYRLMSDWKVKRVFEVKRFLEGYKPDIVHIQYPTQGYIGKLPKFLPLLLRLMRVPIIQTWHEHYGECEMIGWQNLLSCKTMIYVRPDFLQKTPVWLRFAINKENSFYVPNVSTIPKVYLNKSQIHEIKNELSGGKPIIFYFGFANPNKGIEQLFEIADPVKHHLVLACDLNDNYPYQAAILSMSNNSPWSGAITITGFLSAQRVGEILAVADAVVFPFPNGAGEWNTTLKAAELAGVFTIATTQDENLFGYNEEKNIYYVACNDIDDMKKALKIYQGTRKDVVTKYDWESVAVVHEKLYREQI
jgi:glycosyltransferase involved in cell wall biosynthesis